MMAEGVPPRHHVQWHDETRFGARSRPWLLETARVLRSLPERRLLDVSTPGASLKQFLPRTFDYTSCDLAPGRGGAVLDRTMRIDPDPGRELSLVADREIDVVHVGGVIECLEQPGRLLSSLRGMVARGTPLVVSLVNFQSLRYRREELHPPDWIYKPRASDFAAVLAGAGWRVARTVPLYLGDNWLRGALFAASVRLFGSERPWLREHAGKLLFLARAV